ncbi:hypothetical protein MASR2M48_27090 [Spirochaetota bacterium]
MTEPGFKYNMPDILAAIGRVQLGKSQGFLAERRAVAKLYDEAFSGVTSLELPPRGDGHAWHLYSLRTRVDKGGMPRDELVEALSEHGIGSSVHFIPLHTMPYYAQRYGFSEESFPNAQAMFERTLSLPIWQGMGLQTARRVADTVTSIVAGSHT